MYNKEIESNRDNALEHNKNLKKAAAERLARNAAWNKANKPKKTKE